MWLPRLQPQGCTIAQAVSCNFCYAVCQHLMEGKME